MGGIINIITKTFKEDYNNDEIKIESKFGQYNLKGLNFHLSKRYQTTYSLPFQETESNQTVRSYMMIFLVFSITKYFNISPYKNRKKNKFNASLIL